MSGGLAANASAFAILVCLTLAALPVSAQDKNRDEDSDETDSYESGDYGEPVLQQISREERTKAIRELKRVERRSRKFRIFLNRGKMERLKNERLVKVLKEYDRFVATLEELPEDFVKACKIGSVWFSDEIVDASGQHAGGFASGEGINLAVGFGRGTVYHEMFHKFECCISDSQRREWDDLNPDEFIYEGSAWDAFAGNDEWSKKAAAKHLKRIKAGKGKSARELRDKARSKKDARRIAANKTNETVQAAFINGYAQTTPGEDRAEVFRCMIEEGPRFFLRTQRSEHMRKKMEFMIKLTGTRKFLGPDFWEEHSDVSTGGGFGYMWWIEDEKQKPMVYKGAFSARGLDGQRLTVIPELDMVVAHLPRLGGAKKMKGADYKKILKAIFLAKKDPDLTKAVMTAAYLGE